MYSTAHEIQKLTKSTNPGDHLLLAAYYKTRAERLKQEAANYEEAACNLEHHPPPKNLSSPTTAGRYRFYATNLRDQAAQVGKFASYQEEIANALSQRPPR